MNHQIGKKKLNKKPHHKRSLIRNQVIHLITYGKLITTQTRAREVKKVAEKLVTLARSGNTMHARRQAKALLPYKEKALIMLFKEIAPRYVDRPGGYTRLIKLGYRTSDTAKIAQLEWV